MGVQVNRIEKEFIFTRLMTEKIDLSVHGNQKESTFRITSFDDDSLTLRHVEDGEHRFERDEHIRLFFSYQVNYYTLETTVLDLPAGGLTVANPKSIYRDPQRKYERIRLKGLKLFFNLEGDKVELDFPKTDTFTMVEKPEYSGTFNPEKMSDLVAAFRASLQDKVSEVKIVMYRDRGPASFEERLTVKLGKTLWIPSTADDLPLNDPGFSGNIIVKREVEDFLAASGTAPYLVRSEVSNILYMKTKNNITAELYCPVLYHEYAVGYIHACNRQPREEKFAKELLLQVIQFSRILSYSLEIQGYYRQHQKGRVEHNVPVIDMSASGLLFAAPADLDKKIDLFHDLPLQMEVEGRSLAIGTRVMRKFKDAERCYFAAQFLELGEDDRNFLFEFLYGKPFSEEAQRRWEGGAPPPAFIQEQRPE